MVSYNVGRKSGCCLSLFMQTRAKEFVKVSNVSTFPNAFPLVFDSNLHDWNETNPGLTLFSAELPWCYFCAEIKVLGMEQNFARNFYTIKENFWSQEAPKGGT